ncbi:MAG: hypothetical protein PHE68_02555 [Candidatus Peribacteraceae bacterium]|nr:hypothetical protein [Candidatus Peribacteraceae bacterium]
MKKSIVEHSDSLSVQEVKSAIPKGAVAAVLEIGAQQVQVTGRKTNLHNGYRYCFLCPQCGRPVEKLYRRDFSSLACRSCLGLLYASSVRLCLPKAVP